MRVYELANEAGVSSVDVVKAANASGIEATCAISSIDGSDDEKLRAALAGIDKAALAARRAAKAKTAAELNAEFFAEQRAKLAEHLRIAKEAGYDFVEISIDASEEKIARVYSSREERK